MTSITDGIKIYNDFTDNSITVNNLVQECKFDNFTINEKVLCRTGSFQGDQLKGVAVPWLRCPSIEHQKIYNWTSCIFKLKCKIEKEFNVSLNIAKIQLYTDGNSFIYNHSDKILDLDTNTPIFIARFGATRTCTLESKDSKQKLNIPVSNDSLLVIDYSANKLWKHGILKEPSITEQSVSIVFRKSVTFLSCNTGYVYGQHCPLKTNFDTFNIDSSKFYDKSTQKQKMVNLFAIENKSICNLDLYSEIMNNCIYPF
jgi:hypothetical protein